MSWHFSQALEEAFLQGNSSDGGQLQQWKSTPSAQDDSCSDKMKGTFHRSPFGMMYVPLTDGLGVAVLTWFLEGFPVKPIAPQLRGKTMQTISGRSNSGSWQMSLPGTYLPKMSKSVQLKEQPMISLHWVTKPKQFPYPRKTWVAIMFGKDIGYLHTPTTKANYSAKSMQKWPCARAFSTVFGKPTPEIHEWLMTWPIGWTDSMPLETDKFLSWQQQHGGF